MGNYLLWSLVIPLIWGGQLWKFYSLSFYLIKNPSRGFVSLNYLTTKCKDFPRLKIVCRWLEVRQHTRPIAWSVDNFVKKLLILLGLVCRQLYLVPKVRGMLAWIIFRCSVNVRHLQQPWSEASAEFQRFAKKLNVYFISRRFLSTQVLGLARYDTGNTPIVKSHRKNSWPPWQSVMPSPSEWDRVCNMLSPIRCDNPGLRLFFQGYEKRTVS